METIQSNQMPAKLLEPLGQGETLALMEKTQLIGFFVPAFPAGKTRPAGLAKDEFTVPDDFNDPIPELEESVYGK